QPVDLSGAAVRGRYRVDFRAAEFCGAAVRDDFFGSTHEDSDADADYAGGERYRAALLGSGGDRAGGGDHRVSGLYQDGRGKTLVGHNAAAAPAPGRCAEKSGD